MASVCPNCHQELKEKSKFCPQCGYELKEHRPEKVEHLPEAKIENDDIGVEMTRVNRKQVGKKGDFTCKQALGIFMVLLAFFLLVLNYYLNYSATRVEDHFHKGMRFDNYERVARVTSSAVAKQAWEPEDIANWLENFQQAGLDVKQIVMDTPKGQAIEAEELVIAELEGGTSYLGLFPRYKMMIQPLPLDLSVPNEYRDILLKVPGQENQPFTANEALVIEPRASEIVIQYSVEGREQTASLYLNYSNLSQGRHQINLLPVTNRLITEPASLGIRPSLEFDLLGIEIDGQFYEEDIINLSGFVGQVFSVKVLAEYNGSAIESSVQEVALIESSELLLDFLEDEAFQRQILQAE